MLFTSRPKGSLLYHYTSAECALDIIASRRLRFGSLGRTNDPLEFLNYGVGTSREVLARINRNNQNWYPAKAHKFVVGQVMRLQGMIAKATTKLICLTEEKSRETSSATLPRMWAQYGINHSGCCLVFDRKAMGKVCDEKGYRFGPVVYEREIKKEIYEIEPADLDENLNIYSEQVEKKLSEKIENILFAKTIDWEGEREVRIVSTAKADFFDIRDSLIGVIFGCNTKGSMKESIVGLLTQSKVRLGLVEWENGVGSVQNLTKWYHQWVCLDLSQRIYQHFCTMFKAVDAYYFHDPEDFTRDFSGKVDESILIQIENLNFELSEVFAGNFYNTDCKALAKEFDALFSELVT